MTFKSGRSKLVASKARRKGGVSCDLFKAKIQILAALEGFGRIAIILTLSIPRFVLKVESDRNNDTRLIHRWRMKNPRLFTVEPEKHCKVTKRETN
jgi:hypothetical protein